ncbi:FRG domain-containing protein [Aeromonas hydrophila]|uniref:FRG domain-containing protein n=1 Tax=Aeromonas hydrophila TaxID=644 RepID=A0AAX3P380_AERHY|nr:FRG domain-containing protein [Aeromonas hydrophila]WEE25124.1 FRG domain-containing protein [Aeromonas hydrophila]
MAIKSVSDFIENILGRTTPDRTLVSYRGHGSVDYELRPSIFRGKSITQNEHILLRELIAAHPEDFTGDTSALEILVRMQHYSLPTRLLDVSLNPLVALYFACESVKKRTQTIRGGRRTTRTVEMDGHVIVLRVAKRHVKYFDSDTVSCVTNLARLSYAYKSKLNTELDRDAFNEITSTKRLLHFIRQEKNSFLPEINPEDLNNIFLVKPKQNNKRIIAQAGAFFAFGLDEEIIEDNDNGIGIERIIISGDAKGNILLELDKLGINEKMMFPDIERAARYLTGSLPKDSASRFM